jgi:L,D-transpeptidase ErfK/SrfK
MIKKASWRILPVLALLVFANPAQSASVYNKDYVGEMEFYRAKYEDTLVHLARKHGLGFVEMRAANPHLDPWIPGEGARVVLPKQSILPDAVRSGIVINLPEMKLYYFQIPGQPPLTYSISPGREGLYTPVGTTAVMSKKANPTWTPTPRMLKEDPTLKPFYPPGPDNPLGTHALYLGFPDIRIHGTNKPYAIGRLASSGCIRMYPESIRDLYPRVPVGTKVTVVDQPVKVGWIGNKMYVEVSPTMQQAIHIEKDGDLKSYEITAQDMKRITGKAGPYADKIDWEAVRKAVREHRGYPVPVLDVKGAKGVHVQDETEEKLKAGEAEEKAALEKQKSAQKAMTEAREIKNSKNEVYSNSKSIKQDKPKATEKRKKEFNS